MSTQAEAETTPAPEGDTTMAALAHASALFVGLIGPLLLMVIAEDDLVEQNAKKSLNFQIMVTIGMFVSGILTIVLIGFLFLAIILLIDLVLVIMATLAAKDGKVYSYPYTPDLV